MAIHLRRSFLRFRPSAPPDARAYGLTLRYGAAQMNRCVGSAPHLNPSTRRANKVVTPPATTPFRMRMATVAQPPGTIGEALHRLRCLKPARFRSHPLSGRGAWKVEEKVRVPATRPSAWTANADLRHRQRRDAFGQRDRNCSGFRHKVSHSETSEEPPSTYHDSHVL